MTAKTLIVSVYLSIAATAPAFAGENGVVVKHPGATARSSRLTEPPAPLNMNNRGDTKLGSAYAILDTRSIFAQSGIGEGAKPTVRNGPPRILAERPAPVFRGAMIDDIGSLALMEIQEADGSTRTEYLREGQTVSWGDAKVLRITMDTLRLSRVPVFAGQMSWIDVAIGCNLNGAQIGTLPVVAGSGNVLNRPGLPRPGVTGSFRWRGANNGDSTAPGSSLDAPLPSGSADDIAARMIARRQEQLRDLTNVAA
jgi:hypothetical protein